MSQRAVVADLVHDLDLFLQGLGRGPGRLADLGGGHPDQVDQDQALNQPGEDPSEHGGYGGTH